MPSSCLAGTSPTASIPSRGRIYQDQVGSSHTQYAGSSEASRPHQPQKQDPSECHAYRGILDPVYFTEATQTHTHTVAGIRDVPVEITGGLSIDRHDLRSTHEEADILIAQHAISLSLLDKSVRVVCDDAYIFVLLVPYYNSRCKCSNRAPMIIVITSQGMNRDRYSCHRGIT